MISIYQINGAYIDLSSIIAIGTIDARAGIGNFPIQTTSGGLIFRASPDEREKLATAWIEYSQPDVSDNLHETPASRFAMDAVGKFQETLTRNNRIYAAAPVMLDALITADSALEAMADEGIVKRGSWPKIKAALSMAGGA